MKIRNKKYLLSKGVAFYPEKEMETLKQQAQEGWHFQKLNIFGFLVFEKSVTEEKKFSVDFYYGTKEEINEYLTIYSEAGWECISNFKEKYFYFKANPETPAIYSEAESYSTRIKAEWKWLFLHSLRSIPYGLLLTGILLLIGQISGKIWDSSILRSILVLITLLFLVWPLAVALSILFGFLFYKRRPEYYNCPQKFAKKQRYIRDCVLLAIIGGVVGFFLGMFIP